MNIGLDIDGCLTDIETFHLKYGVPFFEKKFNKSVVNEYGKSIKESKKFNDKLIRKR